MRRWPFSTNCTPMTFSAATMVKKANARSGANRSSRSRAEYRTTRMVSSVTNTTPQTTLTTSSAADAVGRARVCSTVEVMPVAMTSAKIAGIQVARDRGDDCSQAAGTAAWRRGRHPAIVSNAPGT